MEAETRIIPVGRGGLTATVDEEDYEWLMRFWWFAHHDGPTEVYAERRYRGEACHCCGHRRNKTSYMHQDVARLMGDLTDAQSNTVKVDHVDGNRLNNTRANIRVTSALGNARNRRSGGFKGTVRTRSGSWEARITVLGRKVYLGAYSSRVQAARVYDVAAVWAFDGHAGLNFPADWDGEEYLRACVDGE